MTHDGGCTNSYFEIMAYHDELTMETYDTSDASWQAASAPSNMASCIVAVVVVGPGGRRKQPRLRSWCWYGCGRPQSQVVAVWND